MATAMEAAIVAGHGQWVNNLPIAMQDADASQLLRLQQILIHNYLGITTVNVQANQKMSAMELVTAIGQRHLMDMSSVPGQNADASHGEKFVNFRLKNSH